MSQDIRNFLKIKPKNQPNDKLSNPKKRPIIISSDEDEAKTSLVKRTKKSNKRKINSDSEDELKVLGDVNKIPKNDSKKQKSSEKLVAPSDILGKGPIRKGAAPKIISQKKLQESDIHRDSDFDSALEQLDISGIEINYLSELNEKHNTEETSNSKEKTKSTKNEQKEEVDYKKEIKLPKKDQNTSKVQKGTKLKDFDDSNKKKPNSNKKPISKIEIEPKKVNKNIGDEAPPKLDFYEERIKNQKLKIQLYHQYLNRGGAKNPGSKAIPEGANDCLKNLTFIVTGILDSLEREETEELIKKYGGRVVHSVSKKVNLMIVGDQPGLAKITKAESLEIPKISEDDFLELIRTRSAGKNSSHSVPITLKKSETNSKHELEVQKKVERGLAKESSSTSPSVQKSKIVNIQDQIDSDSKLKEVPKNHSVLEPGLLTEAKALVDKYRPRTMKQIIGQQAESSSAHKLFNWLKNWDKNQISKNKTTKSTPWVEKGDGTLFKAVLLSGPPGVGKTTTAQIVCHELKFDLLEFNASDTRSKKLLKDEVKGILSNTSMKNYFNDSKEKPSNKHVLLMDEVDGMAGNEDRGGLQELIALIKSTEVPIICICNDRQHPKMRTLSNYTFDLKFQKPRLEQIKGAMKSICFKEKIDISNEDLEHLILSTNQDIRQTINHLALVAKGSHQQEKSQKQHGNKHFKLGPWDVVRKVFSANEHKNMTIHDKSDLFFHDYSIAPLFVQENYLSVNAYGSKDQLLAKVANAANSMAVGDIIEKKIRSTNSWSLLPVQAFYSSVIPGSSMSGDIVKQINFPSWFGRNSKTTKYNRLLQEITAHSRLATRGSNKQAITLDYVNHLRNSIVGPLMMYGTEGVDTSVNIMNKYNLIRQDFDSLLEVSLWPGQNDPMQSIEKKVKAAFTRALNNSSVTPYSINNKKTKRNGTTGSLDEDHLEGDGEGEEDEDDERKDDIENDGMIKEKKPSNPKTQKTKKSESKPGKSQSKRGKGRGKK